MSASYAQSVAGKQAPANERIRAWITKELVSDPNKQWLHDRADVYDRVLQIQAARELGIPISELSGLEEAMPEFTPSQPADTGVAVDISKGKFTWQNETSVAISRTQPWVIAAGANDQNMYTSGMPVYYTTNYGKNWSKAYVTSGGVGLPLGDPMLAAGPDGTFYYAYLMQQNSGTGSDNLFVATSTNARTWVNGTPVLSADSLSGLEDKEQICVDNNSQSPYYGRLYLVWVHYNSDNRTGKIMITHSDDKCTTWSKPVALEQIIGQFGEVRTGKNGEVIVSYSNPYDFSLDNGTHNLYVSTDGGATFVRRKIADFTEYVRNTDRRPAVKGDLGPRCYPFMSFDVDQRNNTIHLVYGSDWNRAGAVQRYVRSTDLGKTWSAPVAIGYGGADPGGEDIILDRFCPWVVVNQHSGDAYLTYYSSERDSGNQLIGAFRYHLNGSSDELTKALDSVDFDPTIVGTNGSSAAFIGDYIGADIVDSIYAGVWTQGINTDGEVYIYVGLPLSILGVSGQGTVVLSSDRLRLASVFPNPATDGRISMNVFSPVSGDASLSLYDISGTQIATLWNGRLEGESASRLDAMLPNVAAGTYIVRLSAGDMTDERKIVVGSH